MNAILQSVIEKTIYLGTGRQSYSILQIQVKTFSTINTIEDPCYSADTLGLNEWISAVSTKPDQQSSRKTTIANHTKENILDFLEASWNNLEKSWKDTIPTVSQKVQKTSTGREYLTWQKTVSKKKWKDSTREIILNLNGMGLSFYCSADFLNYPIWSSHCMAAI